MSDSDLNLAVAEAFSRHRFSETFQHLADDVRWHTVGAPAVTGREAVIAACQEAAAELASVETQFVSFRVREGKGFVVVEATAGYGDDSQVTACDIYTFAQGRVAEIVSYNVETTPSP